MAKSKSTNQQENPILPSALVTSNLEAAIIISLPPVIPEVRVLLANQTTQFILEFIEALNECLVVDDRINPVEVGVDYV